MTGKGDSGGVVEVHGFCDERFAPLEEVCRRNQEIGLDEGASIAVTLGGELVVDLWAGTTDSKRRKPWERDTIVCVFSSGKFMVILAVLMLYDRGLLDLDAPIAEYWPEFAQNGKQEVTTRQVLTHTSGLPGFGRNMTFAEISDWTFATGVLERAELFHQPGERSYYHAQTFGFLLGEIVRRISGQPFNEFFDDQLAGPASADFHFGLTDPSDQARIARLWYPDPATLPDAIEDRVMTELERVDLGRAENLTALNPSNYGCGNGRSLARLASILAMGGELDGVRYMSRETVDEARSEQSYRDDHLLGPIRCGLGFGLHSDEFPAPTPEFMHWGGFGGSFVGADPTRGIAAGIAPNRLLAEPEFGDVPNSPQRLIKWFETLGSVILSLD